MSIIASESESSSQSCDSNKICGICLNKVKNNDKYAKIKHPDENKKKYHYKCLDQWFKDHTTGIITRKEVTSFLVYKKDNICKEVIIMSNDKKKNCFDNFLLYLLFTFSIILVCCQISLSVLIAKAFISMKMFIVLQIGLICTIFLLSIYSVLKKFG